MKHEHNRWFLLKGMAWVCSGLFFFQCAAHAQVPEIEREALVALYDSTHGAGWSSNSQWLNGDPCENNWYGVTCDQNANIIGIDLQSNRLAGTIPASIGDLVSLQTLVLSDNWVLRGSIPVEIGQLSKLRELTVTDTSINGSIPVELGNLVSLNSLMLAENRLTGTIPASLGELTNLTMLNLGQNGLAGFIPRELGDLINLITLDLHDNFLKGLMPGQLGKLVSLKALNMSENLIRGPIPAELGNLPNLEYLNLYRNRLSGPIPAALGNLTNLEYLNLYFNKLSDSVPVEFGNLSNLEYLHLGQNQLSGSIPAVLGSLTNLIDLSLGDNQLSGSVPPELGSLNKLTRLILDDNQLSGSIPVELGNLNKLLSLNLDDNQLSGSIPAALGNLTNLTGLSLGDNQLSGSIPTVLGNLTNLNYLYLSNNQLSGSIPAVLGNLTLGVLQLSSNQLSGSIPAELGKPNLWSLKLNDNQLSGSIPAELGNLGSLCHLELAGNKLSGPIPTSLSNLGFEYCHYGSSSSTFYLGLNALYTDDADLSFFLSVWAWWGWSKSQTIAPDSIKPSHVGPDSVTLTWNSIEYTAGEGGYRVWYGTSPGGPYLDGGITATKSATTHTVAGLNRGQDYYFVVTTETNSHASNSNLVVSEKSNEIFVSTSLTKPTSVRATDGTFLGLVRVTFNTVADATVYRVFRCLDMGQTCGSPIGYPTAGTFDDRNAVPGTVYYYRVRACITNDCGKFSAANSGFANIPPPQPTGISASDGSFPDRVEVSWNAVEGASIYRVFRCLDKGQTCGSPVGYPNGTSFEDRKGDAGTVYQYRVKACNTMHCSKFSAANAGHRNDAPALEKDEINAFLLPGEQVPIPTLSVWSKWLLMLMTLGLGLMLLNRQCSQSPVEKG